MKYQRGFTLIELMVAVSMVAVVTIISIPSYRGFIANRRTAGAAREIYNALQYTRILAIKEGRTVSALYLSDPDMTNGFLTLRTGFCSDTENSSLVIDDRDLMSEVTLPKGVIGTVNRSAMQYNSRGILVGGGNGTVTTWNELTGREYKVIANNLGTLSRSSGIHPSN